MTKNEAKEWYDRMPEEERVQIVLEHHLLRQMLCAQTIGIATGTDDWIARAVRRAERLRESERQLRKIIHTTSELLEDAKWKTGFTDCPNCCGRKTTSDGNSCSVCKGTGRHTI